MVQPYLASAFVMLAVVPCSPAQEAATKPDLGPKKAALQKAFQRMAALPSYSFSSKQLNSRIAGAGNNANGGRVVAGAALAPVPAGAAAVAAPAANGIVRGSWSDGLLWASSSDGKDQVVWRGRRMIGKQGEGAWQLRAGVVGEGAMMPRALEPETFFQALTSGKLEVIHAQVGQLEDKPIEVVTAHASGDDAYALLWSGLIPDAVTNAYLPLRNLTSTGARGRAKQDLDVDLALWLDPATGDVRQLKVRCYTKMISAAGGGLVMPGGAPPRPGAAPEPELDDEEAAKPGPLAFEDGLPVRKPRGRDMLMVVSFDVTFQELGTAKPPALDATARELLGMK
jgi:hypothetical protein